MSLKPKPVSDCFAKSNAPLVLTLGCDNHDTCRSLIRIFHSMLQWSPQCHREQLKAWGCYICTVTEDPLT